MSSATTETTVTTIDPHAPLRQWRDGQRSTITQYATRDEWLAGRGRSLGASESPAALGISPWKSRGDLWAEKAGRVQPDDLSENEAIEWGLRLERPIAEAFGERTGRTVSCWPSFSVVRHSVYPWLTCTPDALQSDRNRSTPGLLQIKTTSAWNAADWEDGPPLYYQVQLMHELAVTGLNWGTLACLVGGQKLIYVDMDRHDEFINAMIQQLREFWACVMSGTKPADAKFSPATVSKLHPNDNGETAFLPAEAEHWAEQLEQAKEQIKAAESRKEAAETLLKAAIGDATFGQLPNGTLYSWKSQTRRSYVVEEKTFRVLRRMK